MEALESQRKGLAASFCIAGGSPVEMKKGPSKNPYLGGTAARATYTVGGE